MRRLALLAAVLAVACSSKKKTDEGDRTPPAAPEILAPAVGALLGAADLSAGNVSVSGTAEAGATVEVRLDAVSKGTVVAAAGGAWSLPVQAADGAHALDARATDAAGNASPYSGAIAFTVDTAAPAAPAVLLPAQDATLNAADLVAGFVVVSGTAEPGATVALEVDGVAAGSAVASAGGSWSVAADVADGAHALRARATDPAGNASAYSDTISFTLDATPPALPAIAAPAPGALLAARDLVAGKVAFAGTADPGTTVDVQVDGSSVGTAVAAAGTGAWSVAAAILDGAHAVRAGATDAAGNPSGLCAPVAFALDTVAPAVPVVAAPADGVTLQSSDLVAGHVVVSGTADADASVEVLVDGAPSGSAAATGGVWSVAALVDSGTHTLAARAIDAAGNASALSAATSFTLDGTRLAYPLPPGSAPGVTSFGQTVAVVSPPQEVFPGQANGWALDRDFSLAQNMGFQYGSALVLYTGTPTAGGGYSELLADLATPAFDAYPWDQSASEVVFLTPVFGAADGVVTAAASDGVAMGSPALSGARSAFLNGTSDSRLSRTLALTPGHTYTFSWTHKLVLRRGNLPGADAAPYAPWYRVVLRDPSSGAMLGAPLYASSSDGLETIAVPRADLPAAVVLSFELRSAAEGYAELDDVQLLDGGSPVALANGDFEAGLAGWDANGGAESQNVRSAPRDVYAGASALRVTRTFYAPPASPWGRMVDVFENPGAAAVSTTAVYLTALQAGSPLAAVTQGGEAVVGWDAAGPAGDARDVGIVLGNGRALVEAGSPIVLVAHDLTVPAGGKVALVHFVVQLGEAAGGPTAADVPAATDAECAAALAGFPAQEPYRIDLEPGVLGRVANF